ncbi:hypothetical protein FF38_01077, partial [Lucilia cuprina]
LAKTSFQIFKEFSLLQSDNIETKVSFVQRVDYCILIIEKIRKIFKDYAPVFHTKIFQPSFRNSNIYIE